MTDSPANDRVTADGLHDEGASAVAQDEVDASQRNPDVNGGQQAEASAVAEDKVKDLEVADRPSDSGKPKPDVDVLAKGIASVLGPVMNNFDGGVEGVLKSQSILASSIDRLTRELDKLLEDVPHPYATHHATRLSGIRKRVIALNTSLRIIQKRMEMIQRLLGGYALKASASASKEKGSVKGFQSTSNNVILREVPPHKVSSYGAGSHCNDELSKAEYPGNVPSEGLQDATIQEKRDLKDDIVVSPNKEAFIEQEPVGASIAGDEVGEVDVKGI
ncbi:hypothetical protein L7F22_024274 [Adiantum nelumboides]|nr:hypothetical protein [Adiantum nelumboides]